MPASTNTAFNERYLSITSHKRDPSVGAALCSASGRLREIPRPAHTEVVEGAGVLDRIGSLIKKKYLDLPFIGPLRWTQKRLHLGRQRVAMVGSVVRGSG